MQPFQPNFNQIQAPGVTPQFNPQQINLGIDQVAAEFNRQESGRRQNLQAMRANQDAMQRSIKTQMNRSDMDWKNYQKLAKFSSTLSDTLVENQNKENKRVMMENMNQAFIDGADPNKQARYNADVAKLSAADDVAIEVSRRYLESGGLPDIAAEIEKRSGWAAYGYAVGIAKNGSKNYAGFLRDNRETPVGFKANGDELSLASASNSAEYLEATKLLRAQYVEPYLGLNQELLNEHLVAPMRLTEDQAFADWEEQFAKNRKKELELQQTAELFAEKENPIQAARLTQQLIEKEARRNGGNWLSAKKTVMSRWKELAETGRLTQLEWQAIAKIGVDTNAGKNQQLLNTAEGKEILNLTIKYNNETTGALIRQRNQQKDLLLQTLRQGVIDDGPMEEEAIEEAVKLLVPLGMSEAEVRNEFPGVDKALEKQAVQEVTRLVNNNQYVPEGLLKQIGRTYPQLRQLAIQINNSRRMNMGLTKDNGDHVKGIIKSQADELAGTVGTSSESSTISNQAQRLAKEWSAEWFQGNRYRFENESEMMADWEKQLLLKFSPEERKLPNGRTVSGFEISPFNPANQGLDTKDYKANLDLFRSRSLRAMTAMSELQKQGIKDPYSVGAIPGTEEELEMIYKALTDPEDGVLPANTPIFNNLARQSQGRATALDIITRQLKLVHGYEYTKGNEGALIIEKSMDPEELRKLINAGTPNTLLRAGINHTYSMENADQQGALSDPSDPNSPRIGSFIGGDGDQIAQAHTGKGGLYSFEIMKVPGGFGPTIQKAADMYGIPPAILAALIEQESRWDPQAYNKSGATGIAQIIPRWHPEANPGVDPHADIMYAAKYLRQMMTDYGFDLETAIYGYNAGPNAVLRYGKGMNPENRKYYPEIMERAKKYRRKSYQGLRSNWEDRVADSPYNSPDLLSPNLRGRIYQLA